MISTSPLRIILRISALISVVIPLLRVPILPQTMGSLIFRAGLALVSLNYNANQFRLFQHKSSKNLWAQGPQSKATQEDLQIDIGVKEATTTICLQSINNSNNNSCNQIGDIK